MIFTARTVKGQEAYELGILNKLVSAEELLTSAEELAAAIMKNAPLAVEKAKHVRRVFIVKQMASFLASDLRRNLRLLLGHELLCFIFNKS